MLKKHEEGNEKALETLKKIIEDADIAMLVSIGLNDQLVSRPMKLQKVEYDGDIWFLTRTDTDKYEDIKRNPHVNIVIMDKSYASISGIASFVDDRTRIEQYWNKGYEVMFDLPAEDPRLTLIKVSTSSAEYWDTGSLAKSAMNFMKKVVGKESPIEPGEGTNETLEL